MLFRSIADVHNADCGHDYDANMMALLSTMLMHGDSRDVTLGSTGFVVEMWGVRIKGDGDGGLPEASCYCC